MNRVVEVGRNRDAPWKQQSGSILARSMFLSVSLQKVASKQADDKFSGGLTWQSPSMLHRR